MARGDELAIERIGPFEQGAPFYMRIAEHAGVGRAPGHVLLHEIVNHVVAELFSDVHDKMVETELDGHVDVVTGASANVRSTSPASSFQT